MNRQWWCIIFSMLTITYAFECPKAAGCGGCLLYPDDIYKINCAIGMKDFIQVEIRPNDYLKLTCYHSANWTKYHFDSSHPVNNVKTLHFNMCNLPEVTGLGPVAKQLLNDNVEILHFCSYKNISSALTRQSLRDFGSLKELTLTDNNLSNLPEDLIEDLANLKMLNLRNNNLRYLPKKFFGPTNLEIIELATNKFETLDSSSFGKLDRLRFINIWNNKIVKIHPNTFDKLVSLETLGLQRNKLETLPVDVFVRLAKLKFLNLSQNNFTTGSIPADLLRNCSNLESFLLIENRRNITTLPNEFFGNLTKLTRVRLRKIGLLSLPEDLFWGTLKLQNVSLERNSLFTLPSKIFNDTHDLLNLDLSFNDLSSLPDDVFANLRKLVKVDLSKNHLTTISRNLFTDLTSLRELNMDRNNMISIQFDALASLKKLRIARFSYNSLTLKSLSGRLESPFRSSQELEELHLDHNNISDIFKDWIYSTRLRILNLSYNRIQLLKADDLQFLSEHLNADLTYNNISHIKLDSPKISSVNGNSSRNVIISIENNPIECDCKIYNLLRYLEQQLHPKVQNAFHLKIGQLRCNAPNELQKIAIADLKSNSLKCDTKAAVFECHCSKRCEYYVRPGKKVFLVNCANVDPIGAPRKIESSHDHSIELNLTISNNSLTAMPNFDQPGHNKVAVLALDHNNISDVSVQTLSPNLTVFKLNNNGSTGLNNAVIDFLKNSTELRILTLKSNPWFCDCEASKYLRFVQKTSDALSDLLKATCLTQKMTVSEMTSSEVCRSYLD